MLNSETKRKIDYLRNSLVGKIPVPSVQIEQITLGLIYKFMSDIDEQNEELGGKSFFSGEYKKYSWRNIMDPSLAGHERVLLYSEGLEKMSHNDKIPQLFRDIFKGAYLPFKDTAVLSLFLKGINEFKYENSEELGDAFEYLLSTAASQGDAGQFRTPRHIIDFIVEVVDPQKEDRILDPACGTAGFLVSAYKHILKKNIDKKSGRPGSSLSATERKKLTKNIVGYDISHEMVRLSLVNLYLHGFAEPNIYEYDTLSSLERWDDSFDCLLANPPFMTPKGGIQPHNRFPIQSKRAEVLFVDYITEHLSSNGKAGIIVPEGIIFQSGNTYKQLRKMLVEDGLWAVVSLPQGVFNPYAGVKTSILFYDNNITKKVKEILFVKIENDGFDLGAQRRPIDKNDLPQTISVLQKYKRAIYEDKKFKLSAKEENYANIVKKEKISENEEYNLSAEGYKENNTITKSLSYGVVWPTAKLGDVIEFLSKSRRKAGDGLEKGVYPFFTSSPTQDKWLDVADYKEEAIILGTGGSASVHIAKNFSTSADVFVIKGKEMIINKYLYHCLKNKVEILKAGFRGAGLKHLSKEYLKAIKIPLPPIEVQKEIVIELDGYQRIIDGSKQVLDNYKPIIKIDPKWEVVDLEKACEIKRGKFSFRPRNSAHLYGGKYPFIQTGNVVKADGGSILYTQTLNDKGLAVSKLFRPTIVLITIAANIGDTAILDYEACFPDSVVALIPKDNVNPYYLELIMRTKKRHLNDIAPQAAQKNINIEILKKIRIPLPPVEVQKEIIARIENEQKIVGFNREIIKLFEQKIKEKISELWGE